MWGTVINSIAIIIGGSIGLLFRKRIKPNAADDLKKALGIALIVLAISGVISNMFSVESGELVSRDDFLMVISIVIGTVAGELLNLDGHIQNLSMKIEKKAGINQFAKGFSSASIFFCVGAMAIIGSINDGLNGNISVLLMKSILDFSTGMILATTLGVGVVFGCIPVFIYKGILTLFAGTLSNLLVGETLTSLCLVGYTIILGIGIDMLGSVKIKTANMLPSMLVPIIWALVKPFF